MEYKLACLMHQPLCGQMPTYLADDIHLVSESRRQVYPDPACWLPLGICK